MVVIISRFQQWTYYSNVQQTKNDFVWEKRRKLLVFLNVCPERLHGLGKNYLKSGYSKFVTLHELSAYAKKSHMQKFRIKKPLCVYPANFSQMRSV